jgi:antitoxin VapB
MPRAVRKRRFPSAMLDIDDPELDGLAQQLAARTGETVAEAVKQALRERLARTRALSAEEKERRRQEIAQIVATFRALPVLDDRSPDEILGYNEHGAFD